MNAGLHNVGSLYRQENIESQFLAGLIPFCISFMWKGGGAANITWFGLVRRFCVLVYSVGLLLVHLECGSGVNGVYNSFQ